MELEYIYCSSCGYESFDEYCTYSRQTANGEWYYCPCCGKETINVDEQEDT